MDLSFSPMSLDAVDRAEVDAFCLFLGEDERPMTGLAGLLDWRLAGGLSRLLMREQLTGKAGEVALMPQGPRLKHRRVFVFGVGASKSEARAADALSARITEAMERMERAGMRAIATALPPEMSPDAAIAALVAVSAGPARATVFDADPNRLVTALAHVASRPPPERRVVKVHAPHRGPSPTKVAPVGVPKAAPLPFMPSNARPGGPVQGGDEKVAATEGQPRSPESGPGDEG